MPATAGPKTQAPDGDGVDLLAPLAVVLVVAPGVATGGWFAVRRGRYRRHLSRRWYRAVALAWVVGAALLVVGPALAAAGVRGLASGPSAPLARVGTFRLADRLTLAGLGLVAVAAVGASVVPRVREA